MAGVEAANSIANISDPSLSDAVTEPVANRSTHTDIVDFGRPMSPRKRRRSSKPTSAREIRAAPASATRKASRSSSSSPVSLTGAVAIADERRGRAGVNEIAEKQTSPNQAQRALDKLIAAGSQLSKPIEGPKIISTTDGPMVEIGPMETSNGVETHQPPVTSPQSISSNATLERVPTTMSVSNGDAIASPGQMDDAFGEDAESPRSSNREHDREDSSHQDDGRSNKAFTYPGPLGGHPHRTSSLPQSGYGRDNISPSAKRHKCPYCNTDFTRHHNLKSHLLTHSQEKPFSCDKCDSRFRRLHDLKRHAKLHTGERPHVCPKCDRSFARGDALARHNKGQGGCAGRRESMGSFGGDDRHDEAVRGSDGDGMPGMIYTNEPSHEPEHMDEDTETPAGRSLPSIKKHDAPAEPQRQLPEQQHLFQSRQPSTYPPVAARPSPATNQLYPPPPVTSPRSGSGSGSSAAQASVNHYPPPPTASSIYQASASNVFAQSGSMTESPKPLSPGGANAHQLGHSDTGIHRNRSPSLSQQVQQHQFRRATGNNTSPPMSLPPPNSGSSISNAPHLPPLHGLTPPDPRYTLHSQANGPAQMHPTHSNSLPGPPPGANSPSYPPGSVHSANNSSSSQGTGQHGSLDRNNPYGGQQDRLWAAVESLASKVNRLEEEIAVLRGQPGSQPPQR